MKRFTTLIFLALLISIAAVSLYATEAPAMHSDSVLALATHPAETVANIDSAFAMLAHGAALTPTNERAVIGSDNMIDRLDAHRLWRVNFDATCKVLKTGNRFALKPRDRPQRS